MGGAPCAGGRRPKVFCIDCYYFNGDFKTNSCMHRDNRCEEGDTWFRRDRTTRRLPKDINSKNNCKWYDAKTQRLTSRWSQ